MFTCVCRSYRQLIWRCYREVHLEIALYSRSVITTSCIDRNRKDIRGSLEWTQQRCETVDESTNQPTNSFHEANNHSPGQEILRLLWHSKVRYYAHNTLPVVHILDQMHPVHTFPPYFPKIYTNIILPSTLWSLPFRFSDQNFVYISHLSHACYMPRPSHPPWLDHPNRIRWSLRVMKLLIMLSSSACCNLEMNRLTMYNKHQFLYGTVDWLHGDKWELFVPSGWSEIRMEARVPMSSSYISNRCPLNAVFGGLQKHFTRLVILVDATQIEIYRYSRKGLIVQ